MSDELAGNVAMGHTRWATHGAPTDRNAHPHQDCHGRIAVIHNGIIENFQTLRARLEKDGHALVSETDTECIAHLIEEHARDGDGAGRRRARHRPRAAGRVRARRGVRGRPRSHRRGQGLVAARGRHRRRRDAAGVGHPRAARPDHDRDPGRGRSGRRGPARRRRVHRPRREPAASRAHRGRLGRRARAEGRLRGLHAEGDPRAAGRDPRHAGRSRRGRPPDDGRAPDRRRRVARGRQGLRRRVRHGVPLRPRGEVRDRALDAAAGGDRDRERVPLSRPRPGRRHADARGQPIGRDDRHARGRASRAPPGFASDRGDEHRRVVARAGGRRRVVHARRAGDRRGGHEDVRDTDGVAVPGGAVPGAGPRLDVPRGDRRDPRSDGRAPGPGAARDRVGRAGRASWPSDTAMRATCCSSAGTPDTPRRSRAR